MKIAEYLLAGLPVLYLVAVLSAYKYRWRWLCTLMLLAILLAFFFLLGIQNAFAMTGSYGTLVQHNTPIWGFLLLLLMAAVSKLATAVDLFMVTAHIFLGIGAYQWGMGPKTDQLGMLFLLAAPIWLGIRISRPRPDSMSIEVG